MNLKSASKLFKRCYSPYRYFCQRYRKAAKKERIRKKWRARFGPDLHEMCLEKNPLWDFMKKVKYDRRAP